MPCIVFSLMVQLQFSLMSYTCYITKWVTLKLRWSNVYVFLGSEYNCLSSGYNIIHMYKDKHNGVLSYFSIFDCTTFMIFFVTTYVFSGFWTIWVFLIILVSLCGCCWRRYYYARRQQQMYIVVQNTRSYGAVEQPQGYVVAPAPGYVAGNTDASAPAPPLPPQQVKIKLRAIT